MPEDAAHIREVRVPDNVWAAAQEACREEGVSPDAVVTAALEAFAQTHRRGAVRFGTGKGGAANARSRPASSYDRRVQIAAAKARVQIDKLTGETTPDWVVALSKEERDSYGSGQAPPRRP